MFKDIIKQRYAIVLQKLNDKVNNIIDRPVNMYSVDQTFMDALFSEKCFVNGSLYLDHNAINKINDVVSSLDFICKYLHGLKIAAKNVRQPTMYIASEIDNINGTIDILIERKREINNLYNKMKIVQDIINGDYDEHLDALEGTLDMYEYDIIGTDIMVRFPEIIINEGEENETIVRDTFIKIPLMNINNFYFEIRVMNPTMYQVNKNGAFPHIRGGVTSWVSDICMGSTPFISTGNPIFDVIVFLDYIVDFLKKKQTDSVYNELVMKSEIDYINKNYVNNIINASKFKIYKRRFLGADVIDLEIMLRDTNLYRDSNGIITEDRYNDQMDNYFIIFKGNKVFFKIDKQRIDNEAIKETIEKVKYESNQSKTAATIFHVEAIKKFNREYISEHGDENKTSMLYDTKSRMGGINILGVFRGRKKRY